ncbi:hypothetical protein D3C78_1110970 [compost metagenome]
MCTTVNDRYGIVYRIRYINAIGTFINDDSGRAAADLDSSPNAVRSAIDDGYDARGTRHINQVRSNINVNIIRVPARLEGLDYTVCPSANYRYRSIAEVGDVHTVCSWVDGKLERKSTYLYGCNDPIGQGA